MSLQTRDLSEIASKSFDFMVKLTHDVGNLILLLVLNLIPVVNFIVVGYFVTVVKRDASEPPKLSDFGGLFVEGLKLLLAVLIYALIPLILLLVGMGGAFIGIFMRPSFFRHASYVLIGAAVILLLLVLFFALPILGIYMRTGDFSKIFAFGESWDLISRFGLGNYILFFLLLAGFNAIAYAIGSVLPWIGTAVVGVFASAFTFRAISLFVNIKYPLPPPPPSPSVGF